MITRFAKWLDRRAAGLVTAMSASVLAAPMLFAPAVAAHPVGESTALLAGQQARQAAAFSISPMMLPVRDHAYTVDSSATGNDTNTGDGVCRDATGHCTLWAAIEQANASSGTDLIRFQIGSGAVTINDSTGLPGLGRGITIDGTTQPGYSATNGHPAISLDGRGTAGYGLDLALPDDIVLGLEVGNFTGNGIAVDNGYGTIEGCYVGVDRTGTRLRPNGQGIELSGGHDTIAATAAGAVNVVAANTSRQVFVNYASSYTSISGIYVGTTADGTASIAGGGNGIDLFADNSTIGIPGTPTVVASSATGVNLYGHFDTVQDSYIGTDAAGTTALSNTYGVQMQNGDIAVDNLISGNSVGISGAAAQVWGNRIGLDATGHNALPNTVGVQMGAGALIGGYAAPSSGNVISGNNVGLIINGNTTVAKNRIGTNRAGTTAVPNGVGVQINGVNNDVSQNLVSGNSGNGIEIESAARFQRLNANVIGQSVSSGPLGNGGDGLLVAAGNTTDQVADIGLDGANVIADNAGAGVDVASGNGVNLTGNRIFDNTGLGIDLAPPGVTLNDAGDVDSGPNMQQNFPSLKFAAAGWANTTLDGTLSSTASTDYRIDFYDSPSCDPSGFGEGAAWIGSTNVTTDVTGSAPVSYTAGSSLAPPHTFLTATATDPDGNTSEFGPCTQVSGAVADVRVAETAGTTSVAPGGRATYQATVRNAGPDTASAVSLTITISRTAKLETVNAEAGTCTIGPFYRAVCTLGNMATAAVDVVSYKVEYGQAGRFAVRAAATAKSYDPDHSNNSASVTTRVT